MRFAFTEDQILFRDTVRDFFTNEFPASALRAAWDGDTGAIDRVWAGLSEMGVIGLTVPEDAGGMGMNELDLVLLMQEAGRVAYPGLLVETTAVAVPLMIEAGPDELRNEWLERIASGDVKVTVALSDSPFVLAADTADLVVLERNDRLFVLPGDKAMLTVQPSIDKARRLFGVDWNKVDEIGLTTGSNGSDVCRAAANRGALGAAAQLLGLADAMLELTVSYVTERRQFGVPVGTFQAVKHRLANALMALEFAKPVVYRAAYSMATGAETASRDVAMAKCYASDAAERVARESLQCHGAIAYTVEYDMHMWMKRTWALSAAWGDAAHHRRQVAQALIGPEG